MIVQFKVQDWTDKFSIKSITYLANIKRTTVHTLKTYYKFLSEEDIKEDIYLFNGYLDGLDIIYFNTEEDAINYIRYISDKYNVMQKLAD